MQFDIFFIEYKLRLKTISKHIVWSRLPLYRKIGIVVLCFLLLVVLTALLFKNDKIILLTSILAIITDIVIFIIDSTPRHVSYMLNNYYKPHSHAKTTMIIKLLNDYNISEFDTDRISLLIQQVKEAQTKHNPFFPIVNPLMNLIKYTSPIIISIGTYTAQELIEKNTLQLHFTLSEFVVILFAIIGMYTIFLVLAPILRNLIYWDNAKYDSLIYDLTQIKIFTPVK